MQHVVGISLCVAFLIFFAWLFTPNRKPASADRDASGDPFIDPDDTYQIGLLAGLTGGTIPDAALMRFALKRFQEIHGRRATSRDIGIVLGLIESSD